MNPRLLSLCLLSLLAGCKTIPPIEPMDYGTRLPNGHVVLDEASYYKDVDARNAANAKIMWGCTIADGGTSALGILGFGLREANPLGALVVPAAIYLNTRTAKNDKETNRNDAVIVGRIHCGAAALNLLTIALLL